MKKRTGILATLAYVLAAAGFAGVIAVMAWLMRPDMTARPPKPPEDELEAVRRARSMPIDPNDPPVLYRQVDYSEGPNAPWYPKGQSPILDELVAEGTFPPVAERVGSEPAVVEGVEGIGKYGGTWIRVGNSDNDALGILNSRMGACTLLRWSPQGFPLVPHVAKSFSHSDDYREFTFELREGMRWSDGHPFTADDILYWWECDANDPDLNTGGVPPLMMSGGEPGRVEQVGRYRFRIVFPKSNGLFLPKLATFLGVWMLNSPEHYLKQFHPRLGDREKIEAIKRSRQLDTDRSVYNAMRSVQNPECPRLWPWVFRTYKANPPFTFVRNPYYFMVDTKGNQLPYVDRLHFEVKSSNMIGVTASNGQLTMQARHLRYEQYTLLMSERERSGYEVLHWYPGDRSQFLISVNLNRRKDPDDPVSLQRAELLADKRFRQALSLAIDRQDIIDAEYSGNATAGQCMPGPASRFHDPEAFYAYTAHDPNRANAMLDELGLTRRDFEGFRTYPDGSRMVFYLNLCGFTTAGPAQFVVDDWADVGIRVVPRIRSRQLFYTEKFSFQHDFSVWSGNGEFYPLIEPRYFVPLNGESNYAIGYARWWQRGGLYGDPRAERPGAIEPPPGHPARNNMILYDKLLRTGDFDAQMALFRKMQSTAAEQCWAINICTPPPALVVVKDGFRNVPPVAVAGWDFLTPGNTGVETYYFEENQDTPGAIEQAKASLREVTLPPDAPAAVAKAAAERTPVGTILRWGFLLIGICLVLMVAVRHPYIARRLLIMIPTLLIISVIVFTIIQLPPGDYITSRIMQLQESGDTAAIEEIKNLEQTFHLKYPDGRPIPVYVRYVKWMGLGWFVTFDEKDSGLLQGNLGRSMASNRPVNQMVGDRITLTVLISLGTILFTWAVAIPTGIYSAVRQYSVGDYILTFVGFIGMCVPSFLLALILMYLSKEWFGIEVGGLFSSQYGAQPEWDWAKVRDLLEHIWVPVIVLGVGGTAGMIRVMRGNLLDELKKPYVTTARAKGVRPTRLLMKYPVRMALNPFISGIGHIFPQLVSGGAIVAMVLSLPTVGPLMLDALMTEDMYLAGSMLMVLSLLGVVGTLVSDLLLLWLDPRIRYEGSAR